MNLNNPRVITKECSSGERLPLGKTVEVDNRRERERNVSKTVKRPQEDTWEETECAAREW